ncbi:IclR family transcriptional regulator [Alicyclobacillus cycloheptanicus]|uniref:DNA-binding IclR family transcriptional regulator n=1 Tax=Alicyclobacillus cycloheptanicus TaxID=1457 RepID=A0ABT9XJF6_9BACL|nr:IclR family transcriptional regulator [Alicyclobacillus cycloheptanicus]MDQ0189918.1 DNA-binding IclR family transcriptional regulator [Alicyclobacillus cycloheptanicus]WDM02179.1 IclR family transcriptional regulator [Alicyclobacillus cycloheptanicus]
MRSAASRLNPSETVAAADHHAKTRTAQTLARGLQILDCFANPDVQELGIKELTQALQLPQTNVARLVATLEEAGYVAQNPDTRKYRLGLRAYLLGLHANPNESMRTLAEPVMERLARTTHETVSLNVIDAVTLQGVCIASIDSPAPIKLTTRVGSVRPLYRGASRKVLLAFADAAQRTKVLQQAESQLSGNELRALMAELERILQVGYAVSEEELDVGAYSVAAPILSRQGRLLAGLAVAGPIYRRTDTSLQDFIHHVRQAAKEVSDRLPSDG